MAFVKLDNKGNLFNKVWSLLQRNNNMWPGFILLLKLQVKQTWNSFSNCINVLLQGSIDLLIFNCFPLQADQVLSNITQTPIPKSKWVALLFLQTPNISSYYNC